MVKTGSLYDYQTKISATTFAVGFEDPISYILLELKELLNVHPKLKIVLMSATINHEVFVKYFDNAPLLTIPGVTHPVQDMSVSST